MKRFKLPLIEGFAASFSILERIDVGETSWLLPVITTYPTFSILERIDVGETHTKLTNGIAQVAFSILERIDVGETLPLTTGMRLGGYLSVSSNGSTWVKL